MRFEILNQGAYPALEATIGAGEELIAEAGAMTWMDPEIDVATGVRGGVLAGLSRKLLTGESFFQNTYSTQAQAATVAFAAGQPGALAQLEMAGGEVLLERGAYMASTPDVNIESRFQGLKGLFAEGIFVLRATGTGTLFFSGYGDLAEIEVDGEYVVDNGFAVAWDASLDYRVTRAKRIRSFLFADQLLMRFSGRGRLWAQSRSSAALANWIHPYRRLQRTRN